MLMDEVFIDVIKTRFLAIVSSKSFKTKIETKQTQNFQANAFLCSSMNLELVCAILQGIKSHIKQTLNEETEADEFMTELKSKSKWSNELIHINKLEIMNPEVFQKVSVKDMLKLSEDLNSAKMKKRRPKHRLDSLIEKSKKKENDQEI